MIPFALGIAVLILAYAVHRAKRTPIVGRYRLAWSDPTGWTWRVAALYLAGWLLVVWGVIAWLHASGPWQWRW